MECHRSLEKPFKSCTETEAQEGLAKLLPYPHEAQSSPPTPALHSPLESFNAAILL